MSRVNDGVAQSPYASLKAFHDEVGVTGGDSWDEFYNTYRFGYDPSDLELGDRMARFWDSPANSIYARAVFALDARRTPGVPAAGNTTMDLSSNAMRVRNGTTGSAMIVQDGRGGKALQTQMAGFASAPLDFTGTGTSVMVQRVRVRLEALTFSASAGLLGASGSDTALRVTTTGTLQLLVDPLSATSESRVTTGTLTTIGYTPGEFIWLEISHDQATGIAVGRYSFSDTNDPDQVVWTTWDMAATPTTTGAYDTITSVGVGSSSATAYSNGSTAQFARAQWLIDGTLVADFDPTRDASYSSLSWASATTGETWTVTPGGSDNSDATYLPAPSTLGVTRYVYLPGLTSNYLSTPDAAALDITGDIDIRVRCALDDWTPSDYQYLLSKAAGAASPPTDRSYWLFARPDGGLRLGWSDGTTLFSKDSTATMGLTDGSAKWVRVTLDVDNGAAGNDVRFYTSDDGVSWTQLGSTVTTAGVTAIASGGAQLEIGGAFSGVGFNARGRFFQAQVYDGIDGSKVFDWSAEDTVTATHSAFIASTGQTVTVNRATSGRKTVVVEAAKWLLGTDDYLEIPDNALLDLDAATDFTVLAVVRQHATPVNQGRWISKRDPASPFLGWEIRADPIDFTKPQIIVDDGPDNVVLQQPATTTLSAQGLSLVGLVVDRTAATLTEVTRTGTLGTSGSTAAVGDCSNAFAMRIGSRADTVGSYQDFELYAVYIWREALSASELAAIAADWGAA